MLSNCFAIPITSNLPPGSGVPSTAVSLSMNSVHEPVRSVIVRVRFAVWGVVGQAPAVRCTPLMRTSRPS